MRDPRGTRAALVRRLTSRQAARAGRFALVIGAHLLVLILLLHAPEIRVPVEAQVESYEISLLDEPRRPIERTLGPVEPKLTRPLIELPPPPEVRIPDVSATVAALPTPSVHFDVLSLAAPSVPQPGGGTATSAAGGSDHGILIVSRVDPPYPPIATLLGQYGTVIIGIEIDAQSRLQQVRVVRSSGARYLDRAAAAAVRRWRFRAASKDGRSIGKWGEVQVNFYVTCGPSRRPGQTKDARNASCLERSRAAGAWRFQR